MNNSSDNIVRQFNYGGFNGTVHSSIEFVVVERLWSYSNLKAKCRRSKSDLKDCVWCDVCEREIMGWGGE